MIEPSEIDQLRHCFRLPKDIGISKILPHMVGKVVSINMDWHHYIIQFYESIHTRRQISADLNVLRLLVNHGFEIPTPLISRSGDSIETTLFPKPIVVYSAPSLPDAPMSNDELLKYTEELALMESAFCGKKKYTQTGKQIVALFTMFELLSKDDNVVDDLFKSEYFAFKSSYIDLLNRGSSTSFGFFPGNDHFFLSKENRAGFTHRSFIYELPTLFALSQFILATCFKEDGSLDYNKMDAATTGFANQRDVSDEDWSNFDAVLKLAAFFDVLCHWLASVYHPHLVHTDRLIEARMKQKHLKKLRIKEVG